MAGKAGLRMEREPKSSRKGPRTRLQSEIGGGEASAQAALSAGDAAIQPYEHVSRGKAVYHAILDEIRDGALKAGDRLREQDIAARFGMSRTPVREGLGRLLEKGLLVAAGGRGLTVRALSTAEVIDLYAMREILEGAAARLAAQHASAPEIAALADLHREFVAAGDDYRRVARLNREFHGAIHRAARNAYLETRLSNRACRRTSASMPTFSRPSRNAMPIAPNRPPVPTCAPPCAPVSPSSIAAAGERPQAPRGRVADGAPKPIAARRAAPSAMSGSGVREMISSMVARS